MDFDTHIIPTAVFDKPVFSCTV